MSCSKEIDPKLQNKNFLNATRTVMKDNGFIDPAWNSLHTPAVLPISQAQTFITKMHRVLAYILESFPKPEFADTIAPYLGVRSQDILNASSLRRKENLQLYKWDIIEGANGWQCLELDVGADLGGMNQDEIHKLLDTRHGNEIGRCPLRHFLAAVKLKLKNTPTVGAVCLLDTPDYFKTSRQYYESLCVFYSKILDHPVIYASLDHLILDSRGIWVGNRKVGALIEMTSYADLLNGDMRCRQSYESLIQSNKVLSFMDPLFSLLGGKGLFAFLKNLAEESIDLPQSYEKDIFPYLPPTNYITTSNYAKYLNQPNHWILKKVNGMGGHDVVPGWEVSNSQWQFALEKALHSKNWVVQGRVQNEKVQNVILDRWGKAELIQVNRVLALFGLSGQLIGGHTRASPASVINAQSGAGLGVIRFH